MHLLSFCSLFSGMFCSSFSAPFFFPSSPLWFDDYLWCYVWIPFFCVCIYNINRSLVCGYHEVYIITIYSLQVAIYTYGLLQWLNGKESTCQCRRPVFNSWVGKIPWRGRWQPTPVFLPGECHGQRSLMGYMSFIFWNRLSCIMTLIKFLL